LAFFNYYNLSSTTSNVLKERLRVTLNLIATVDRQHEPAAEPVEAS